MTYYWDGRGTRYAVKTEERLGGGGEGTIYPIDGMEGKCAKIFHDNVDAAKLSALSRKICYMQEMFARLDSETKRVMRKQVTWPEVVLLDSKKRFAGYIMPKIVGHETLNCAYLKGQQTQSSFTFAEKVQIAKNLCIAVNLMHERMHTVVGDFNCANIMHSIREGTVYLVDADSFHIQSHEQIRGRQITGYMPTNVGRPEYLPRELHDYIRTQNASLDTLPQPSFNVESDRFGLAIHIFQLLMNGTHPYGLRVNPAKKSRSYSVSKLDISWAENIRKNRYVYSKSPHLYQIIYQFAPPTFAPSYDVIPDYLQAMFERAFVTSPEQEQTLARTPGDGKYMSTNVRPSAGEWYQALDRFSRELQTCRANPKEHQYGKHLTACPWCEARKNPKRTA